MPEKINRLNAGKLFEDEKYFISANYNLFKYFNFLLCEMLSMEFLLIS